MCVCVGGGGGGVVFEVRTWSGVGVNVLVCTRGAAFEMDLVVVWGVSVDTTI